MRGLGMFITAVLVSLFDVFQRFIIIFLAVYLAIKAAQQ